MPVDRVTSQQFATEISNDILSRDSSQDTAFGPIRDLCIRPQARVLESQNERIRQVFNLLSLINAEEIDPEDLDDFVFNEDIIRSPGTRSTTSVIFSRAQAPTSDITVSINFPLATVSDESTGLQVQFVTTEEKTMLASSPGLYFNADTSKFELEVSVRSVITGADTRVGAGRIKLALRGLGEFEAVTNRVAATGGTDEESNTQLAQRYLLRVLGTDISTPTGVVRFVKDFFTQVEDVVTAYGDDEILDRQDYDAGAVDVYILGDSIESATETKVYPGTEQLIALNNQPVRAISSIVDTTPTSFVENTDFVQVLDTSVNARSVRGTDGIEFLTTGAAPADNDSLTITYTYNSLVGSLQSFFSEPDFYTFGRDLLFKQGTEVSIILTGVLTVSSGDPTTVLNNVLTAISTYINTVTGNSGGLGSNVEEFDINREVAKVQGVDNFVISQLSREGGSGVQDVVIEKNEYARISSANLNVSLT